MRGVAEQRKDDEGHCSCVADAKHTALVLFFELVLFFRAFWVVCVLCVSICLLFWYCVFCFVCSLLFCCSSFIGVVPSFVLLFVVALCARCLPLT